MKIKKLSESRDLSSGIFWIVDLDDIDKSKYYCFTIPCDLDGTPYNSDGLNAKSGATYNHEKTWKTLPPKMTHNKHFDYYPRGRVQIANNKAIVYLNPNINTEEVQKFIIRQFNLDNIKTTFKSDGSEHYKCYLDN